RNLLGLQGLRRGGRQLRYQLPQLSSLQALRRHWTHPTTDWREGMNDRTPLPRPPHGIGDKTREVSALLRELGWWPLGEQHYFELERGLDCLAALLPPAPAIPEGWRLVPEVATYEMVTAGMRALREAPVKGVYASMLDAAPTPPVAADAPDHAAMHQQLLDMLGAKDHVDAARIIGQHHAREIAP